MSAINGEHAHVEMFAIFNHRIGNLQSEFTRGREGQALHITLMCEVIENGEGKRGGLAGAGLGLTDHIHAGEHQRNHSHLNWSWLGIAKLGNRLHQFRTQV